MSAFSQVRAGWGQFRRVFHAPAPVVSIVVGLVLTIVGLASSIQGFAWSGVVFVSLGLLDRVLWLGPQVQTGSANRR